MGLWQNYLIYWVEVSRNFYENAIRTNEQWLKALWYPWHYWLCCLGVQLLLHLFHFVLRSCSHSVLSYDFRSGYSTCRQHHASDVLYRRDGLEILWQSSMSNITDFKCASWTDYVRLHYYYVQIAIEYNRLNKYETYYFPIRVNINFLTNTCKVTCFHLVVCKTVDDTLFLHQNVSIAAFYKDWLAGNR
jgi:hypothetical protein